MKKIFEAKASYIEKKNRENFSILENKVSDEVALKVSKLCSIRHDLHSNVKSLITLENELVDWILKGSEENLDSLMVEIDEALHTEEVCIDVIDIETLEDNFDDVDNDEWSSYCTTEMYKKIEIINSAVERFLSEFDKKHNTKFCPTGHARINF